MIFTSIRNYLRLRYVPFLDFRVPRLVLRVPRLDLRLPPIMAMAIWLLLRRFLRAEGVEVFVVVATVPVEFVVGRPEEGTPKERLIFPLVMDIALKGALTVAPISILQTHKKSFFVFVFLLCATAHLRRCRSSSTHACSKRSNDA